MELTKDTEFTLTFENQHAVVSPFGASLRRYFVDTPSGEWSVIWGYAGGANKKGGQGDVLIPFPGRIKNGSYSFNSSRYELAKNDKDGPNAIHGFLRLEMFSVDSVTESQAVFSYEMRETDYTSRGYPFSLFVTISYSLENSGLKTSYSITNRGDAAAPVAIGFHPYFRAATGEVDSWSVVIPASKYIEFENLVPTGRVLSVESTNLDFRNSRVVGPTEYNACLAHLSRDEDGFARTQLESSDRKSRVTLALDKTFDYIVIYTGDQIPAPHSRQGFAIEPMTCAPDAFNHEGWGTKKLEPGANFAGSYAIHAQYEGA